MMKALGLTLLLTIWLFGLSTEMQAQQGGYAGAFSRMGFGPRGIAMGNAMSAFADDGAYAYYNPALAAMRQKGIQADIATTKLSFDRSLNMASVQFQLPPSAGISFSLIHAGVTDIDSRTSSGYHIGQLSTDEYQLLSAFGLRVNERTWLGIGIKYNISRLHRDMENSTSVGFDVGIRNQLTESFSIAVSVHDFFAAYRFDASSLYGTGQGLQNEQPYPLRTRIGVSYTPKKSWFVLSELEFQRLDAEQQTLQTGESLGVPFVRLFRSDTRNTRLIFKTGAGMKLHERVTLRGGLQWVEPDGESIIRPAAGFSLHLPWDKFSPSIDYAVLAERPQVPLAHMFSFRFHL